MIRKKLCVLGMAMLMWTSHVSPVFADSNVTTMENCGAYLFTWSPVDCGNGRALDEYKRQPSSSKAYFLLFTVFKETL